MTTKFEAAAILAGYAAEAPNNRMYGLAAELAMGVRTDINEVMGIALETTEAHPRLPLEAWLAKPDAGQQIEQRVELQEKFVAYRGIARRAASPVSRLLTVMPFHRPHLGSQAIAFEVQDADNNPALLKVPRKISWGNPKREPLTPEDRACFAERRLRVLPKVPGANFEQLKALSYTGAVITSRIPGRSLYKLGSAELAEVTDAHLLKALRDLSTLAFAGVLQDYNGSNTHFTTEHGFGFFDPLNGDSSPAYSLLASVQGFARNLGEVDDHNARRLRTPAVYRQREELFERLRALGPEASPQVAAVLDGMELPRNDTP